MKSMGSRHQSQNRFYPQGLQNLSSVTRRTERTRQIPRRKSQKRVYPTLEISYGIIILLCLQERLEETQTVPRL